MYSVLDENRVLIVAEELEMAEAYAVDRFNRTGDYVEVIEHESNKVLMSLGSVNYTI